MGLGRRVGSFRWQTPALEKEGGRRGLKVDGVDLDLEQLQGDWERRRGTEGQGQGSWPVVGRVEGRRKI